MRINNLNIIIDGLSKGGAETLLLSMLPALRSRFSFIRIYYLSKKKPYTKDFEKYASLKRLPIWKFLFLIVQLRGQMVYVHLFKSIFFVNLISSVFAKNDNVFLCHEHTSPDFYLQQSSPLRIMIGRTYLFLLNFNLKRARVYYIVSSCGAQKKYLDEGFNSDRFVVFPNSFPIHEVRVLQSSRKDYITGLHENKITCFTISRIERIKQIDWAIYALAKNAAKNPQFRFVFYICGEGGDLERLTEIAIELCSSTPNLEIKFEGYVPSIVKYLSSCDFYFLPSAVEGFPLSLTAAAISGINCVTTPFGVAIVDLKENFQNIFDSCEMSLLSFTEEVTLRINQFIASELNVTSSPREWKSIEENVFNLIHRMDSLLQLSPMKKC